MFLGNALFDHLLEVAVYADVICIRNITYKIIKILNYGLSVDRVGLYDLVALGILDVTKVQGKHCCDLRKRIN
jgi:hypothetical protein